MTNTLEQNIVDNINSIIYQRYSNGVETLSTKKLIKYIENKFNVSVDIQLLNDILSSNPHVSEVLDNKISLTSEKKSDSEEVDDEIHDMAVDQANDDMTTDDMGMVGESALNYLTNYHIGDVIDSSKVELDESDYYYHLHNGARKAKKNYVVCSINPKKELSESLIRCRIDETGLFLDIPFNKIK